MNPPKLPRWLGLAGLIPQAAALAAVWSGDLAVRFSALSLGYAYAALILSFLGGLWCGLAAARTDRVAGWVWVASVAPSLVALASAIPWATGQAWPGPSFVLLGVALIAALGVDWRLTKLGLAPEWWMSLRLPLSIGLGLLTIALAFS